MDFTNLFAGLGDAAQFLIPLVVVIIGLFIAWVVGRFIAFLVRRGLERLKLDERASKSLGTNTQITKWVSGLVFWLVFIVVLWPSARRTSLASTQPRFNPLLAIC